MMGKTAFAVKVTRKDNGAAASGLAVALAPMMDMAGMLSPMAMGGSSHGSPAETLADNKDGTYSCAVYFLMAGSWTMNVKIGGETATMKMDVATSGSDTPMVKLRGQNDMIMGAGGAMEPRTYYMFNEGMEGTDALMVYVAARWDMFIYPPVKAGQAMGAMTINEFTIEASQDGENWDHMMDHGGGHFRAHGLLGLKKGVQGTVYVRLAINGSQCTTDGSLPAGSNTRQTFKVTP
jgi:hypothetical protein